MIEITSGWLTWSAESVVATMCTSLRKPSAKPGRIGRSIIRALKVPLSDGRDSRFR